MFLGVLIVVAEDRPQRLRPDPELLERLTGVAALAAPAIQNGLLVDELRHKASHDSLTGLLNRVGFRQHIDRALAGVGERQGQVGLLFVDLDDFKHVNDAHGHDFGDELLRQARRATAGEWHGAATRSRGWAATSSRSSSQTCIATIRSAPPSGACGRRSQSHFSSDRCRSRSAPASAAASGPRTATRSSDLVRHADAAMYQDKAEGRRRRADVMPLGPRVLAAARAPQFGPL